MTKPMQILGFVALAAVLMHAGSASAQTARFEALSSLPFMENRPTSQTAQTLRDELLFQRATQTYLWALPLINTLGMKVGSEKVFGAGYNVLPVWKKRLDAKTLVTTPNSDVIYAMGYVDLGKDGPLVFEAPPNLQGILLDAWQRPIPVDGGRFFGDVGLPGPDGGKGGKFLLVPPGYEAAVPEDCFVYRSPTNNVFVFLRAFYQDPKNLAPAVALIEQSRIYPLGGKEAARPMQFPDASGVPVNMLPISDVTAFDELKKLVESEGENLAESDSLGMLAAIGIAKGRPFEPDAKTLAILDHAARTAYKMSRVIGFEEKIAGRSLRIYPDRRWINPMADATPENLGGPFDLGWRRVAGGYLDLDARIWFFTNYYSISPGMLSQTPGRGAKYMIAFVDSQGENLSGGGMYRLRLPRDIPAANFWSVTLYDAESGSGLANGQPFPSLGSRDAPAQNGDGSTDLFLGPTAPAGKQGNWLATVPGKGYFAVLRLYGPTEAAIDKRWKPGDIEKVPTTAQQPQLLPMNGSVASRLGPLELENGYPTDATIAKVFDDIDYQRACQAYLWALPLMAMQQWQSEHLAKFGAGKLDYVDYLTFQDKLGLLTANATTPYIMAFPNLKETGPLVFEVPAGPTAGGFTDFWQRPITDSGQTGPDKGAGGRYLILGPDDPDMKPEGYYVYRSPTVNVWSAHRVLDPDPARARQLIDALKIYPYSQRDNPAPTRHVSPAGRPWSGEQPRGLAYWEGLAKIIQEEPVHDRDRMMMGMLQPLGIEKGKPFTPTERLKRIFIDAAQTGEVMARSIAYQKRFEGAKVWPGRNWETSLFLKETNQEAPNHTQLDERTSWFYEAVGVSVGMMGRAVGVGQVYLEAAKDGRGRWLDGGKTYRLTVPKDVPVAQFWSVTVYDNETRCFVKTGVPPDRSSRDAIVTNADGSVDLTFGPAVPAGTPGSNWIKTLPGKGWFSYFRLYGPTQTYFDRSWVLPDIEMIE